MREHSGIYEQWGARLNLIFPNGKEIRINARHMFKGNSMWNNHNHKLCNYGNPQTIFLWWV